MILSSLNKLYLAVCSIVISIAPATIESPILKYPIIEIPKINLKQEFYPDDPNKNVVDKNIQVIDGSVMPNQKGNLILASHSGTSDIAYFKNLDKVGINDIVYIYYKDKKYEYIISHIYDVQKTGYVSIQRDKSKQTLTLITCKKNTNKQTVYVGYLNT